MMSRYYLNLLITLAAAFVLNCLSVLLSPLTSPDDLGQLAFVMFTFFPASAVITGILSQRLRTGLIAAPLISALAVSLVILIKYNSSGLVYSMAYAAIAAIGYLLSWGLDIMITKAKR